MALRAILQFRFKKDHARLQASFREICASKKLDWEDIEALAKAHLTIKEKKNAFLYIRDQGVDIERELEFRKIEK